MRKFIAYDLHNTDSKAYQDLYDYIENTYMSYKILESMYVIFTDNANENIVKKLVQLIGKRNVSVVVGDMPSPVSAHKMIIQKNGLRNKK